MDGVPGQQATVCSSSASCGQHTLEGLIAAQAAGGVVVDEGVTRHPPTIPHTLHSAR